MGNVEQGQDMGMGYGKAQRFEKLSDSKYPRDEEEEYPQKMNFNPQDFETHPPVDPNNINCREVWEEYNGGDLSGFYINPQNEYPIDVRLADKSKPLDENQIIKIQSHLRGMNARKDFKNNKNAMRREGDDFVQRQKRLCERNGKCADNSSYCLTGWKEFYPDEGDHFEFDPGFHFKNCQKVENKDDPRNVKVYEGEVNMDNQKHGFGTLTTPDGEKTGTWRNDQFEGWGIYCKRNGATYEGNYNDRGKLTGKGIYRKGNHTYKGDFVDSIKEGEGEYVTDNTLYNGSFVNNKKEGRGILEYTSLGHRYEGEFQNDQINGEGTFRWSNGDKYIGQMKNGKMHGKGKYYYKESGQVYDGYYSNGKKQGNGKIIYPNQKELEIMFNEGKASGIGIYTKAGESHEVEVTGGKISKSRMVGSRMAPDEKGNYVDNREHENNQYDENNEFNNFNNNNDFNRAGDNFNQKDDIRDSKQPRSSHQSNPRGSY